MNLVYRGTSPGGLGVMSSLCPQTQKKHYTNPYHAPNKSQLCHGLGMLCVLIRI